MVWEKELVELETSRFISLSIYLFSILEVLTNKTLNGHPLPKEMPSYVV